MTITRLRSAIGERVFDDEVGRFVEGSAIPCHRCGICCERWQPLVSAGEIERIAAFLGIGGEEARERFTEPYPLDDAVRLLRREGSGCVFLRYEADGRALCSIHPARPEVCRDWVASLDRRECVDGLRRFGGADVIPLSAVFEGQDERAAFIKVIGSGACR
jgi:Fe-S-cluster containining protein